MIVEIIDECILWFIKKPRETMNLLIEVLAYANGTPYTLASLRSVGSAFRDGRESRKKIIVFIVLLLCKE